MNIYKCYFVFEVIVCVPPRRISINLRLFFFLFIFYFAFVMSNCSKYTRLYIIYAQTELTCTESNIMHLLFERLTSDKQIHYNKNKWNIFFFAMAKKNMFMGKGHLIAPDVAPCVCGVCVCVCVCVFKGIYITTTTANQKINK